jgi:hypothetical protein
MSGKIPIVALNERGVVVQRFESMTAAQRQGFSRGEIWHAVRGFKPRYEGLTWKFASDVDLGRVAAAQTQVEPSPDPVAAFITANVFHTPGRLIPFADFYSRFIESLPVSERPAWTKIRVSKRLPPRHATGRGYASKVFLINSSWEHCEAGVAYVVDKNGKIRRERTYQGTSHTFS